MIQLDDEARKREANRSIWPGAGAIVLLAVFAFQPAADNKYIWDDYDYVYNNPLLEASDGLERIWFGLGQESGPPGEWWRIWFGGGGGDDPVVVACETPQYYPLVFSTFYVEHGFWGVEAAGYHWTNILLHAVNAVLLFLILRQLGLHVGVAWLAAALFAVHPVEVESVAWVSERKNVLSGFFYLAALLAWLRFSDLLRASKPGQWWFYLLCLLLFVCALLSKSVTATFPAVAGLAEWLRRRPINVRLIGLLVPFLVIGYFSGLFTAHIEKHHVGAGGVEWGFTFVERCLIASRALCFYAWKLVAPVNLTFIYERWEIDAGAVWQYIFPLLVIAAAGAAFLFRNRVGRLPFFAVSFFAITLFPALGFVDFYPQVFSFVADHFQYLASIGVLILLASAVGWLLSRIASQKKRRQAAAACGIVILGTLAFLTREQCTIYMNQETLWRDTIEKNERDFLAHNNLGYYLLGKRKWGEAEKHFKAAIANNPDYYDSNLNMGGLCLLLGRGEEAEAYGRRCVALKPCLPKGHYVLGEALMLLGRLDEAEKAVSESLRLAPETLSPRKKLAAILHRKGDCAAAARQYRDALDMAPRDAEILIDFARLLAASPSDSVRDGAEAIRLLTTAKDIVGKPTPRLVSTLAAALAETGDFEQAVLFQQQIVATAPPGDKEREKAILDLYRAGKPLREVAKP